MTVPEYLRNMAAQKEEVAEKFRAKVKVDWYDPEAVDLREIAERYEKMDGTLQHLLDNGEGTLQGRAVIGNTLAAARAPLGEKTTKEEGVV